VSQGGDVFRKRAGDGEYAAGYRGYGGSGKQANEV
jgi:hypothetical protein